jgi:hypothetical protein
MRPFWLLDNAFVIWARQEYDNARHYLRNCGRPKDDIDRFLINEAKLTCNLFVKYVKG